LRKGTEYSANNPQKRLAEGRKEDEEGETKAADEDVLPAKRGKDGKRKSALFAFRSPTSVQESDPKELRKFHAAKKAPNIWRGTRERGLKTRKKGRSSPKLRYMRVR